MRPFVVIVALMVLFAPFPVRAHEVRPAYLDISEDHPGEYDVLWKAPMLGEMRLALDPVFSGPVAALTPVTSRLTGSAAPARPTPLPAFPVPFTDQVTFRLPAAQTQAVLITDGLGRAVARLPSAKASKLRASTQSLAGSMMR